MTSGPAPAGAHLPRNLDRLEAGQLVRALVEVEPTYTFKHNLVQQVAYESLLASDRRNLHRHVGETLERLHGEGRKDLAEILASHFEYAGDAAKALEYTTLAGEQAMRRFATAEAAGLFGKAIDLAGRADFDEDRLLSLYQQRGRALEFRGEYTTALELYGALETLGRDRGAPRLQLAGVIGAASLQAVPTPLFDPKTALANAERALALATTIGDPAGQAKAYWLQMLVQTRTDAKSAVLAGIASLDLARKHGLREQEAFTLNDIQSNYQVLGKADRALQALEQARPIWLELDNQAMLADNLASTAMLHALVAEYSQAIDRARESLTISDRIGNLWGQSYGRIAIALSLFARGELGPCIREMNRCIDLAEQAGFVYPQVAMRSILATAYGLAGDLETAARLALRVRKVEETSPLPGQVSGAATQAWVAVQRGDLDQAQQYLDEVAARVGRIADALADVPVELAIAESAYYLARRDYPGALQMIEEFSAAFGANAWRIIRAPLLISRGRALVGLGQKSEAWEVFQTAMAEMTAQGSDKGLWEVEAELGWLARAQGEPSVAASYLASAADHARGVASGLEELALADRFLTQAHIRDILEEAARPAI